MAFYENKRSVLETDKPDQYRVLREIGDVPSSPGIYECQTCKYEDVVNIAPLQGERHRFAIPMVFMP